jgi:hypothetical protein
MSGARRLRTGFRAPEREQIAANDEAERVTLRPSLRASQAQLVRAADPWRYAYATALVAAFHASRAIGLTATNAVTRGASADFGRAVPDLSFGAVLGLVARAEARAIGAAYAWVTAVAGVVDARGQPRTRFGAEPAARGRLCAIDFHGRSRGAVVCLTSLVTARGKRAEHAAHAKSQGRAKPRGPRAGLRSS